MLVVTTRKGKPNVMTVSWTMCMGFEPTVGVMLGPWNYSYQSLMEARECVLAIPGADLMETVVDIGNCSGESVDKFKRFALTTVPAAKVKPPLISECFANIECRVVESPSGSRPLFVLEGVKAWRNPARGEQRAFHAKGDGTFIIDGEHVDLRPVAAHGDDALGPAAVPEHEVAAGTGREKSGRSGHGQRRWPHGSDVDW